MGKTLNLGEADDVPLTTTTNLLDYDSSAQWIDIHDSDVDLNLVTVTIADGSALPSTGYHPVPTTALPYSYPISSFGKVSLQAASAGTAKVTVR